MLELIKVEKGKDQKNTIGGSSRKLVDIVEGAISDHVLTAYIYICWHSGRICGSATSQAYSSAELNP